jgi:hypothetical protein
MVNVAAIAAVVVPIVVSIVAGGLAMAWRLGGLERSVNDLATDVVEMRDELRRR